MQILEIIVTLFKDYLERMSEDDALLNNTELNLIFGKLPPIYDTHVKMLDEVSYLVKVLFSLFLFAYRTAKNN